MSKVIILEGPDGAGKTTLARELEKRGYRYHHEGPPPANVDLLVHYALVLDRAIRSGESVVIDRLHVGESVYGPLIRGVDRIGGWGQIILQRIIRGGGVREVFCLPPERICYGNWFRRRQEAGELVTDSQKFINIYAAYVKASKHPRHSRALIYDYTRWNLGDACAMLMSEMNILPRLPLECIGDPKARFLFVGEIANQKELDLPWVGLNNSSEYLNTALVAAGYSEEEMAFVNAKKLDGSDNDLFDIIFEIEQADSKSRILPVALGGIPAQKLNKYGYQGRFRKMPHPAFWKRFRSTRGDEYVSGLKEIRERYYARLRQGSESVLRVAQPTDETL